MLFGNLLAAGHSKNSVFHEADPTSHFEPTYAPRMLRLAFQRRGVSLNTPDIVAQEPPRFEIYWEAQPLLKTGVPKFLIATENPFLNRLNRDRIYLANFEAVFGWDPDIFDLPNVVQIAIPHELKQEKFRPWDDRPNFVGMINSNKWQSPESGNDLYEERLRIIRWYEKNYLDSFSLWGFGWNKPSPRHGGFAKLKRNAESVFMKMTKKPSFPSYRGKVIDKGEILSSLKFCFCYENSSKLKNYITEKLLDTMVWGCIPIYKGAPNVAAYVPSNTFIDAREFDSLSNLHRFLNSISENEFCERQANIRHFLASNKANIFSASGCAELVASTIMSRVPNSIRQ